MVKKLKELAGDSKSGQAGAGDANLANTVRDSAQQIWLAGLGAFGKAQTEGGKVFEALVKEGKSLEGTTRKLAESKLAGLSESFGRKTEAASAKATATWDKLEQVFEDRVARALGKLGVPSSKDVEALAKRVEQLTASVRTLDGGAGKGKKRVVKRATRRVS